MKVYGLRRTNGQGIVWFHVGLKSWVPGFSAHCLTSSFAYANDIHKEFPNSTIVVFTLEEETKS